MERQERECDGDRAERWSVGVERKKKREEEELREWRQQEQDKLKLVASRYSLAPFSSWSIPVHIHLPTRRVSLHLFFFPSSQGRT